jgi:hypothetical protein
MLGRIISASLLMGCVCNVFGQGSPTVVTGPNLDQSTLYILFLNQHALDASARLAHAPGANVTSLAEHLHIRAGDLPVLDSNALAYAA